MLADLWPKPVRLRSFASPIVHLTPDIRKSVAFIGFGEGGGFRPVGTVFLFGYEEGAYLVTAQHIAVQLGDAPFFVRFNKHDGTSESVCIDPLADGVQWHSHPDDPNVDVSVLPFHYRLDKRVFDVLQIHGGMVADDTVIQAWGIGTGEMCYAVGLFRLLAGKTRNMPIVHTGNIAALPSDERVPVRDWLDPCTNKTREVEAYLVEVSNLQGLSGAPVLVRPDVILGGQQVRETHSLKAYTATVFLLGIWQGSWDAEPDEVVVIERGQPIRVPVGMGVVVPATKLIEILQSEPVVAERKAYITNVDARLAAATDIDDFFKGKD